MAKKKPKSENTVADDNVKKRSIDVPEATWAYVERWADEQDKSMAAVVRDCILKVAEERIVDQLAVDSVYTFLASAENIKLNYIGIYEALVRVVDQPFLKKELVIMDKLLTENSTALEHIFEYATQRFRKKQHPEPEHEPELPLPKPRRK